MKLENRIALLTGAGSGTGRGRERVRVGHDAKIVFLLERPAPVHYGRVLARLINT